MFFLYGFFENCQLITYKSKSQHGLKKKRKKSKRIKKKGNRRISDVWPELIGVFFEMEIANKIPKRSDSLVKQAASRSFQIGSQVVEDDWFGSPFQLNFIAHAPVPRGPAEPRRTTNGAPRVEWQLFGPHPRKFHDWLWLWNSILSGEVLGKGRFLRCTVHMENPKS